MCATTIFMNRAALLFLIKDLDETFWELEDIHVKEYDKYFFTKNYNQMKILFFSLSTLCCTNFLITFFPKFLSDHITLPFLIYQPSWLSINQLLLLEMFVSAFAQILPTMAVLTLLMSAIILTQLQFRMVNTEIEYYFVNMPNELSDAIVKKIVDHHNFLLR